MKNIARNHKLLSILALSSLVIIIGLIVGMEISKDNDRLVAQAQGLQENVNDLSRKRDEVNAIINNEINNDILFDLMRKYSDDTISTETLYFNDVANGGIWLSFKPQTENSNEFLGYAFVTDELLHEAGITNLKLNDRLEVVYYDTEYYEIKSIRKLYQYE